MADSKSIEVGEHNPSSTSHKCSDSAIVACVGCKKVCGNITNSDGPVDKTKQKPKKSKSKSSSSATDA